MRRNYVYLDLGLFESCNLKCRYCRSTQILNYNDFKFSNLVEQIEAFLVQFNAACVKLAGYGEVTAWRDFSCSLEYLVERFPKVQTITNGTFSSRVLETILKFPSVSPNLTIDGHTNEMNKLRTNGDQRIHKRMIDNLWVLANSNRKVELNCVLHQYNAGKLYDFCQLIERKGNGNVLLLPFPVKQFANASKFASLSCDPAIANLDLRRCLSDFPDIMPHEKYIHDLMEFLESGGRKKACHVHWANLGSGGRNNRLHCPNYGEELQYGPMVEALTYNTKLTAAKEIENLSRGGVGPGCASCFNHFHLLNLWLDNQITTEDLKRLPSLNGNSTTHTLEAIAREFAEARK